jgi:hypothetical protein
VVYLLKAKTVEQEKQPLLESGSETIFVSRQRSQINRFPLQQSAHNSRVTVGNGVSYGGRCRGVIRRTTGARMAVRRELPFKVDLNTETEE